MIFVTGPLYAGKKEYIRKALGLTPEEFSALAVWDVQDLVENEDNLHVLADTLSKNEIVIATETGCGVVPLDRGERARREAAGQLSQLLAARAHVVVRVVCGIGQVLKGEQPTPGAFQGRQLPELEVLEVEPWDGEAEEVNTVCGAGLDDLAASVPVEGQAAIADARTEGEQAVQADGEAPSPAAAHGFSHTLYLIRHGQTAYNAARRYQGQADIPLTEEARAGLGRAKLSPEKVFVSPLSRCRETAGILFPDARQVAVPDLMEIDFGIFDGRTADEMEADPDYLAWVEGNCLGVCPGGESRKMFTDRVVRAIYRILKAAEPEKPVVIVAHGGVQMAFLDKYGLGDRPYYMWQTPPGQGLRLTVRL